MTEIDTFTGAFRASDDANPEEHLSELQWEGLACGELDRNDHEAALDHILGCRQCSEIHQSLMVLKQGAHHFDPGAPVPSISRKSPIHNWVFGSILAIAATFLFVIFRPMPPSMIHPGSPTRDEPVLRSSSSIRPPIPLFPTENDAVSTVVFKWEPSTAAPLSIVQLLDDNGEVQWTSQETTTDTMELPGDVTIPSGHYYWRVLALGGPTGPRHASDLVAFDLTRDSSSNPP